jgi:hypothetical protein
MNNRRVKSFNFFPEFQKAALLILETGYRMLNLKLYFFVRNFFEHLNFEWVIKSYILTFSIYINNIQIYHCFIFRTNNVHEFYNNYYTYWIEWCMLREKRQSLPLLGLDFPRQWGIYCPRPAENTRPKPPPPPFPNGRSPFTPFSLLIQFIQFISCLSPYPKLLIPNCPPLLLIHFNPSLHNIVPV